MRIAHESLGSFDYDIYKNQQAVNGKFHFYISSMRGLICNRKYKKDDFTQKNSWFIEVILGGNATDKYN